MSGGEGIVVYCTKGNIIFSSTGEIIRSEKPIRKHKINRSVIHHVFEDMKKFEKSEYWLNLLGRFSKNMLPVDFKFVNSILFCKTKIKKNKAECYIDKEKLEESYMKFKTFMIDRGFLSNEEKEDINKLVDDDDRQEKTIITSWKDISKNKDYFIRQFIIQICEKYNLNNKEQSNLESVVRMGISAEFFNPDNIIIEDEKINRITNLVWNENKRLFSIDTEGIKIRKKNEKLNNNKIFTSYTVETSNDNSILIYKEIEDVAIDKKWNKFLETFYQTKEGI